MARLTANVALRDPSGSPVVLPAGSTLPAWAAGLVGEHALDISDVRGEPAYAPDESWTVADLRKHAADHGLDMDGATKKADILAALAD